MALALAVIGVLFERLVPGVSRSIGSAGGAVVWTITNDCFELAHHEGMRAVGAVHFGPRRRESGPEWKPLSELNLILGVGKAGAFSFS